MRKLISIILILTMVTCLFAGCSMVSEIADSVLNAAMEELKSQFQEQLEEHGVEVVETKTALGKLTDDGGNYQFFCAVLIRTENEFAVEEGAKAIEDAFEVSGYMLQTDSEVESEYLQNKSITYDTTDFSDGTYYTVYIYLSDLTEITVEQG